jgi:hypothetical protein
LSDSDGVDLEAWRALCGRLAELGEAVAGEEFSSTSRERAEGFRHLATQLVLWLSWATAFDNAEFPAFYRNNDVVTPWGGPNVDNVYRKARVSPEGVYRITGNMNACEDFILDTRDGHMHENRYGIFEEITASALGIRRGDSFELTLSATPSPGLWVPLDSRTELVNVREYYTDWVVDEPAVFVIERLDTDGQDPPSLTPERVASMLDSAGVHIEQSLRYWNDFLRTAQRNAETNVMSPPIQLPGGAKNIYYGSAFFDLADDEALLIESELPDAPYWNFQLYTLGWFEAPDFPNRITSVNNHQAWVGPEARVQLVVAHTDPGVPNWLDTGGRPRGLVTYRWFWSSTQPVAAALVVKLADLPAHLSANTPRVTAAARSHDITQRRRHLAWRFRT